MFQKPAIIIFDIYYHRLPWFDPVAQASRLHFQMAHPSSILHSNFFFGFWLITHHNFGLIYLDLVGFSLIWYDSVAHRYNSSGFHYDGHKPAS